MEKSDLFSQFQCEAKLIVHPWTTATAQKPYWPRDDKYYLLSGRWSNNRSAKSENEPDYDVVKRKIHSTREKEWNGMQMTLKKCENHFASFMFSYCVIAPPLSPSPSLLRSQLEIKTKIKTNILYANFCVHCRRFVSFPPPIRLFTFVHIFSQTSLCFFQVLQNLLPIFPLPLPALFLSLLRSRSSFFSKIFIIIVFYYGFISVESDLRTSEGKKFFRFLLLFLNII